MKLSKSFHKIAATKGRIRVIQGAGGSSKTYSILQYLIILCTKAKKPLTISVVAESFPHLRRGAMKDFFDILKTEGLYKAKDHNKTNHSYSLNDCVVEFFGVEDASKLRGARRDVLFVNEGNNINREAFTQLQMRTKALTFIDYNPSHLAWIREYIGDENFVKLTYLDNEFLPAANVEYYLEAIKKAEAGSPYWKNFVEVYVYGNEGVIEGAVLDNWEIIEEVPYGATYLGAGMDFGFTNDPTAITKVYRHDGKIILKQSLYKKGMLNSAIASHILNDDELKSGIIICDSSEPKTIAELRSYDIPIKGVTKGAGSILSGLGIMQGYDLLVTACSEDLIVELRNYVWEKNKDGESVGVPIDKFNHLIDGIRYFFMERLSAMANQFNTLKFV